MKWLIGLVVALGLCTGLVWWPNHRAVGDLQQQIKQAQVQINTIESASPDLSKLAQRVSDIRAKLDQANRVIPAADEQADLLRQLSEHIKSLDLTEPTITTRSTVSGSQYATLPIQVSFEGSSVAALQFINRVEHMPRLVRVKRMKLELDRNPQALVMADFDLESFFYPRSQEATR